MRRAALAGSILAVAAAAAVAAPKGGMAPPPARMDAEGIDAWRQQHIDASGGWALMFADGAALSYAGGPNGVVRDKDGFLHVDVRREYYKTITLGPQRSRSNLQTWVVDCELKRMRVTGMNIYSLNNMRGTGIRKSAPEARFAAVDPSDVPLIDRIRAAASRPQPGA